MTNRIILRRDQRVTELAEFNRTYLETTSDNLDWRGLRLEVGFSPGIDVRDLMVDGHYISMNLEDKPLHFEIRDELAWRPACLPPRTFWMNPEGRPFSIRHTADSHWASCLVDGNYLDELAGGHRELSAGCGVTDGVLENVLLALISCIDGRREYTRQVADRLIRILVYVLATHHCKPALDPIRKGGIDPDQLGSLLAWLDGNFQDAITVEMMASSVGLSAAHFSREFKRSTGRTPWAHVVELRLRAAQRALEGGESVVNTAMRCGFADQPHLSRLFKQRFGVSPSTFRARHS